MVSSVPRYADASGRNTLSGFSSAHMGSHGEGCLRAEGLLGRLCWHLWKAGQLGAGVSGVWDHISILNSCSDDPVSFLTSFLTSSSSLPMACLQVTGHS